MDLITNGNLLRKLRKDKGFTQKELAEKLGVVAKTVSKWETGHGFPDVSTLSALADILDVNERSLLCGSLTQNKQNTGNIRNTKFHVCPCCGSTIQGIGDYKISCCGKSLTPLQAKPFDDEHTLIISEIEDELYLEINHEMRKEHFISFIAYLGMDRILTLRLYPEQECAVRIPKAYSGKIVYYCNNHGLFEYQIKRKR